MNLRPRLRLALAVTGGSLAVLGTFTATTGLVAPAGAAGPSVVLAAAQATPRSDRVTQEDLDRESRPLGCLEEEISTAHDLFHTVQPGDQLSRILIETRSLVAKPLSPSQVVQRNRCILDDANEIRAGMILSLGRRPGRED